MAKYRLTNIACFCIAGTVVQPDENGIADIPDSVTSHEDFKRLLGEFRNGERIDAAPEDEPEDAPKAPAKSTKKKDSTAAEADAVA